MPTEKTAAFREGEIAAAEGKGADVNPYEQDTPEYVEWWEGFQLVDDFQEREVASEA